jgi:hypothetical protein
MVVIPTSNHVTMSYGYTKVDYLAYLLSFLGIAGLVILWRRGPILYPPAPRRLVPVGDESEPFLLDWADPLSDAPPGNGNGWSPPGDPWAPPGALSPPWSHDLGLDDDLAPPPRTLDPPPEPDH